MGGYITWISIACWIILSVIDLYNGQFDNAIIKITAALGFLGIGRKVEKTAVKVSEIQATGKATQRKVDAVQVTGEATQRTAEKIEDKV